MASRSFLTSHAQVQLCTARDPGVRLRDIAASLGITERSAYGIVPREIIIASGDGSAYLLRYR